MKLLIANRNYSSWSLRAWLVLSHFGIEFDTELLRLEGPGWKDALAVRSPTGRVPVLIDGDLVVPETIAIIEYLAERFPDLGIWPEDQRARARARAASAEMHAGFSALRKAAPMNMRARYPGRVRLDEVAADLIRIETLWREHLERSGGPFLFGMFTAADAMFAPVATRIRTYALPVSEQSAAYIDAIHALPAFEEWRAAALSETWVIPDEELPPVAGPV